MTRPERRHAAELAFGILMLWYAVASSDGAVRIVPTQFGTIQSALDESSATDTVRVLPGTYFEAIRFPATNVKLLGEYVFSGDSIDLLTTTIDADSNASQDTSAAITFSHPNTRASVLAGFTLRGGHGTFYLDGKRGGGVYVAGASPTIVSNIITANAGAEAAIFSAVGSPLISHNAIYDNILDGASLCRFESDAYPDTIHFEWNDIRQNQAEDMALISAAYSNVKFEYNRFHDYHYPALQCVQILASEAEFRGNIFEHLTGDPLYGWSLVYVDEFVTPIEDNVFRDCVTSNFFTFTLQRQNLFHTQEICRNLFENISGPDSVHGTGFFIQHPSVRVHDNAFVNCQGGLGAIYLSASSECDAAITRNYFHGNRAHPYVGTAAVFKLLAAACTMTDNWFEDNGPLAVDQDDESTSWDISGNYWGSPSGPYHPTENPSGQGDSVGVSCHVTPWLTEPPDLNSPETPLVSEAVSDWRLEPPFPNPFNPTVNIRLVAGNQPVQAEVSVFDIQGRCVRDLWRGLIPRSSDVILKWDGTGMAGPLPSGVYLVSARSRSSVPRVWSQKAILLK